MPLIVVDHPLVAHRIARLRSRDTEPTEFRDLARQLAMFLAYEAFRDLHTETVPVTTPLDLVAEGQRIVEPGPLLLPILRAGLGLLDGVLAVLPTAEVGLVGLRRDEQTFAPAQYLEKLPDELTGRQVVVLDPMLATGGSMAAVCEMAVRRNASRITALCLIAAPEGVAHVGRAYPDVRIYAAALDDGLNERAFIVPGLGDAGDRLYGMT